ncbi:MAG: hypothetical protein M3Q65_09340 [Chloroflexota bacterium]|nr:hypothetical protein [Chloroflexota bacterium]
MLHREIIACYRATPRYQNIVRMDLHPLLRAAERRHDRAIDGLAFLILSRPYARVRDYKNNVLAYFANASSPFAQFCGQWLIEHMGGDLDSYLRRLLEPVLSRTSGNEADRRIHEIYRLLFDPAVREYLDRLYATVERLGLNYHGQPAEWALRLVHADVCGDTARGHDDPYLDLPITYGDLLLNIHAYPAQAFIHCSVRDGNGAWQPRNIAMAPDSLTVIKHDRASAQPYYYLKEAEEAALGLVREYFAELGATLQQGHVQRNAPRMKQAKQKSAVLAALMRHCWDGKPVLDRRIDRRLRRWVSDLGLEVDYPRRSHAVRKNSA